MSQRDSRTYNDPHDRRRQARSETHGQQARQQDAQRLQQQRRQRAQQQTQDRPWRSRYADIPQPRERATERRRAYGQAAQDPRHQQAQQAQRQTAQDPRRQQAQQAQRQATQHQQAQRQRVQQQAGQRRVQQPARTQQASQYARESYVSGAQRRVSPQDFYDRSTGARGTRGRQPTRYPSRTMTSPRTLAPQKRGLPFSKKLIAAIVAIFVIIVLLFVINPLGCGENPDVKKQGSLSATAAKTASSGPSLPTPIMSASSGVLMHSAVAMEDLTEILIHNASYEYANEITTELEEATNTEILASHGTGRIASEQPTGNNWMTGQFIRCFRSGNAGPVMSAIDCGGAVGATVYAPVSGTVVLVKEYLLYDEIEDYRIHIQPEGRPDLDVVLIHLTDVTVKPGDKVTAGVTPIAKIRDVFQFLGESMQLKQYTALDDNGNHTHIQMNNANHPEYHGLDDLRPVSAEGAHIGDSQINS